MAQRDEGSIRSGPPAQRQRSHDPITVRGFDPPRSEDGTPTASTTNFPRSEPFQRNPLSEHSRRRSSITERLNSIADAGGVNSLNNFARSWQRAAGFFEVTPIHSSFAHHADDRQSSDDLGEERHGHHRSLLRAALEREGHHVPEETIDSEAGSLLSERPPPFLTPNATVRQRLSERRSMIADDSMLGGEQSLTSPFSNSFGTAYGSVSSRIHESPSIRHAGRLFSQQQATGISQPESEREPLLVKQVEGDEGKTINVVVGQSTLPQTVFNSCNVLMGVGILALPLAIRYSGWLFGLVFFFMSAIVTGYTAKLLAKCLDVDPSLITFADLAYISFGSKARIAVSILFSLELIASCVALVIIFADSLDALIQGLGTTGFKIICGLITIPLAFAPLRWLSFTSIAGILSCLAIVLAIIVDGFVKEHALGSLREPAKTYVFPANWHTLPMAFGLLMAPWGGHSVFPNIYRDMRHPHKYSKGVNITYGFTYLVEMALAIAGYLMFGENTRDEITANIFRTKGYPRWLSIFILVAIAIIPLTKLPLNARPIVATIEIFCGLDARAMPGTTGLAGSSPLTRGFLKITIRVVTIIIFVAVAILVPSFDRIMSLLGSAACFTICIILPCAFHLTIFGKELSVRQRMLDWTLIVVCSVLAVVGTAYAFVPKSALGVR